MVVEEELKKIWSRWTMHRRRASMSLSVEEPYVMENGKWMYNSKNQAIHEESHITKCQSLLNQNMK
jgi:transposase-like protein